MKNNDAKRLEMICKMAERGVLHGLYITYGIQGFTRCSRNPYDMDAILISASLRPYITLEKLDGTKDSHPLTFGN